MQYHVQCCLVWLFFFFLAGVISVCSRQCHSIYPFVFAFIDFPSHLFANFIDKQTILYVAPSLVPVHVFVLVLSFEKCMNYWTLQSNGRLRRWIAIDWRLNYQQCILFCTWSYRTKHKAAKHLVCAKKNYEYRRICYHSLTFFVPFFFPFVCLVFVRSRFVCSRVVPCRVYNVHGA